MADIVLLDEIHANTRRTRITYRGVVDGKPAAIKCYRKPLFGLVHWARAQRRGAQIRQASAPVPPVVFSGWLKAERCFCFATAFLEGYRPLRLALREAPSRESQLVAIQLLGQTMAEIHRKGIEQPDGNLTNFMLGPQHDIAMVDEDDIRVSRNALPAARAMSNLANIAARLPDTAMREALLENYRNAADARQLAQWDTVQFWRATEGWTTQLEAKRIKRSIAPKRHFD
ncbi:MAG: hypothetical protein CL583_14125 [Alteromonadaceae bacterium]|nr:hypothetical protein [Alteromonadaceae bacterium]|tara:strand:+ start:565 stop:1251 length:687 start_codon:yes stop_codon:yes gene_type:complete